MIKLVVPGIKVGLTYENTEDRIHNIVSLRGEKSCDTLREAEKTFNKIQQHLLLF